MIIHVRYLGERDLPVLLELERAKWEPGQAADGESLARRIRDYPELSIGAFCGTSGRALASLFMRPVNPAVFSAPTRWAQAALGHEECGSDTHSLFGISLSSSHAEAVEEIFRFFYPRALKAGWRDIFLGSPIPGFRRARLAEPGLPVWRYVHGRKRFHPSLPRDPQLAYYHAKGFREIVSIQQDYFPHPASLDYGVILRCAIPLSRPRRLWRITPMRVLEPLSRLVLTLAG
ncbi:hypothetical protein [Noviherbaspirillum aridicola]|uniref:N-acetyltransferase domain-containing protein n=1 Tax=Noviherbaspirillum aridicola TaxID=2849687 RepID=A0ABQ4Q1C5_9BURK|nr:hypothetical protein [Noviherbaspirillum aridicola]GIZ50909.1 hypothetical protein NCCP691_09230 [Noviherbaspirillum aridicola]